MLKTLHELLQKRSGLVDVAPAADSTESVAAAAAAEAAPAPMPLYVLAPDAAAGALLADMLAAAEVPGKVFSSRDTLVNALSATPPAMILLAVGVDGENARNALLAIIGRGFAGPVHVLGNGDDALALRLVGLGRRHGLDMPEPLEPPLEVATLRDLLTAGELSPNGAGASAVSLDEALARDWVRFWYQPKIDLKKRQIAGVETFARVSHPQFGLVPPAGFLAGASDQSLMRLTQRALAAALAAAVNFCKFGVNLRIAVNLPVRAMIELPIADMVRELGPRQERWPGLLLDVSEHQVADDLDRVAAAAARLEACNVRLAIDDFGRGLLPLAQLRSLPFSELKLDRSFVQGCARDEVRANVCRSVIRLAHHLDCIAVAVGVETSADMEALAAMGCDLGQGYLFGPAMPEAELAGVMQQRAVGPGATDPAPRPRLTTCRPF